MRILRRNRSILHMWVTTYLCILLVPTIANVIIGNIFLNGLNEETQNYNEAYLSKIATDIDNILVDNMRILQRLENDRALMEIAGFSADLNRANYTKIYEYINAGYGNGYSRISDNMKIYLKKSGCLITNDAFAKGSIAYSTYPFDDSLSYDDWKRIMGNSYNHDFIRIGDSLYEIHTIFEGTERESNIFMQFEKTYFKWNLSSSLFPKGVNILIFDTDGTLVYETDKNISQTSILNFNGKSGTMPISGEGGADNIASYRKSEVAGWVYVMIKPRERFYASTRSILIVEIFVLLASLVVSIISLIIFSKNNYKPVKKIMNALGGEAPGSEYDYITASVNNMNRKYNDMSRQKLVAQMLANAMIAENKNGLLADYGIKITSKAAAVVMRIENSGDFNADASKRDTGEILYVALENIFCEIAESRGFDAYFTTCDGVIGILLGVNGDISVTDLLLKINEIYEDTLNVKCSICCGGVEDTIDNINRSFVRAKQVLELMKFTGESGVGCYNAESYKRSCLDERLSNNLRVALTSNDNNSIREIIRGLFKFGADKPCLSDMRLVLYDISGILLKISRDKNTDTEMEKIRIKDLAEAKSLAEFLDEITELTSEIGSAERKTEFDNISKIKAYIAENYTDYNLNNSMIAEHIGMSVNYISKYFKEQTGEGLLNYITAMRVEKAKQLLITTDMVIQDIAAESGFYNALALMRAYKKIEGITPTQYRKIKNEWE